MYSCKLEPQTLKPQAASFRELGLPSSPCRFVPLGMSQSFGVGTPPTGRGVSPVPRRRSSADQRNSVVPFSRQVSTGKLVDNQNSSFEKNFRHSLPSQSQPVAWRPSFTKVSFDISTAGQGTKNSSAAASKLADSPFSKQDGFAASTAPEPAERDTLAGLTAPPESPGRTKSTSLLSQQLNRELSFKVGKQLLRLYFCLLFALVNMRSGYDDTFYVVAEVFRDLP